MATMWDTVNGREMRRRIPQYIIINYKALDTTHSYVQQERGEKVGDILRALEILNNIEPDGIETQGEL
jgi:hypothetical protein